jgi:hypothetical protein
MAIASDDASKLTGMITAPLKASPTSAERKNRMKPFWQRLLGSMAFTLVVLAVLFGRPIVSGEIDLPGLLAILLFGTFLTYLAWPGLNLERWRRWKFPHR